MTDRRRSSPPARPALGRIVGAVAYLALAAGMVAGGSGLRTLVDDVPPRSVAEAPAADRERSTPTTATTWAFELAGPATTVAAPTTTAPPTPPTSIPRQAPSPAATAPAVATAPAPAATASPAVAPDRWEVWFALADCESGHWGAGKVPVVGSANWAVVDEIHQGGLQIRGGQWDQHVVGFPGFPADAHVATPEQQIAVAEVILAGQGVKAWPTCGPRIGLERLVV